MFWHWRSTLLLHFFMLFLVEDPSAYLYLLLYRFCSSLPAHSCFGFALYTRHSGQLFTVIAIFHYLHLKVRWSRDGGRFLHGGEDNHKWGHNFFRFGRIALKWVMKRELKSGVLFRREFFIAWTTVKTSKSQSLLAWKFYYDINYKVAGMIAHLISWYSSSFFSFIRYSRWYKHLVCRSMPVVGLMPFRHSSKFPAFATPIFGYCALCRLLGKL